MLGWSTNELAHAANVGLATVRRFETGRPVQSRPADAMRRALEAAGIEFIAAGETPPAGGSGVRLRGD
jgi:DNA-binding transcriptional regulator YiaG